MKAYIVFPILSVLSVFVLTILTYWKTEYRKYWFYKQVDSKEEATYIFIEGKQDNKEIKPLLPQTIDGELHPSFTYRFIKFKFDPTENKFRPVRFDIQKSHVDILSNYSDGLVDSETPKLLELYGECRLDIPQKSIPALLIDEVLNPFYIF